MCLILEVILTIGVCSLWRKAKMGWAWGLLPVGVGAGIGFLLGSMGIVSTSDAQGLIVFDIAAVIALIIMSGAAQKKIKAIEAAAKAAATPVQEPPKS